MKLIRKRLTYANVMSSIAVFLVVAGGSALAATQLGKNSVGTKQLKSNAVTTAKIKNGAVTGSKLNLSSVGKVPSAATADSATNAVNAVNAQNAANAAAVNGQNYFKVFKTFNPGQTVTVASVSGFTITATCKSNSIEATLTTPSNAGSVAWAQGNGRNEPFFEYSSEEAGKPSQIGLMGINTYAQSTFSAAMSTGLTASGVLGFDYNTFGGAPGEICVVAGHMSVG